MEDGNLGDLTTKEITLSVPSQQSSMDSSTGDMPLTIISIVFWVLFGFGIMGMIGNILTILVFLRLGFSQTIHVSYVALAIFDLLTIVGIMWFSICFTPIIELLFKPFSVTADIFSFVHFTAAWPHFAFSRSSALITAWISFERCLCVVFPTKIKLIITRAVTSVVLIVICIIGCGFIVFAYIGIKSEWRPDPLRNESKLFLFLNDGNELSLLNRFAYALYGAVYPVFSWVAVAVSTTFLISKLRQSAAWRKQTLAHLPNLVNGRACPSFNQQQVSAKTQRVTKTVVIVAVIFIITSLPLSVHLFLSFLVREFSSTGSLRHYFFLSGTFLLLLSELNSSINVIVFAVMGAKFRSALWQLLTGK
ncbi:chemosensory receptor a [Plakobranchus ocellatus]|uniref:Chemosensory receptor a n=1 Tax=Plakobranchus ocellatus TaxID=259542 RepID=A0AAV4CT94_9GAST|nr:chemosensory receptor a [Plakobranchus ocellatus]